MLFQRARLGKPWHVYLGLAVVILLLEGLIATRFRGHAFIRGSVGDVLATAGLYFLSQACWPARPYPRVVFVYAFACLVEFSQFLHLSQALHLRPESLLGILMGNTYSLRDLGMYALGCSGAFGLEHSLRLHSRA